MFAPKFSADFLQDIHVLDDRPLFEDWAKSHPQISLHHETEPGEGDYSDSVTQLLYDGWRARAVLMHKTAPTDRDIIKEWYLHSWRGKENGASSLHTIIAFARHWLAARLPHYEWSECQRIASIEAVDEALREFSKDPTGDAGAEIVITVLEAAREIQLAQPKRPVEHQTNTCTAIPVTDPVEVVMPREMPHDVESAIIPLLDCAGPETIYFAIRAALDAAMASLGLSSITTREQYKKVVASLEVTP